MCKGCGKSFKNRRGVRIHQGKTGCKPAKETCVEVTTSSQSASSQSQEPHHSAQAAQVQEPVVNEVTTVRPLVASIVERLPRLKLPNAKSELWKQIDQELDLALEHNLKGKKKKSKN